MQRWIGVKMVSRVLVCYTFFSCVWVGDFFAGGHVYFPPSTCDEKGQICIQIRKCPFFDDLLNRSSIPRPRSVISVIRKHECAILNNTPYVCCDKPKSTPPPPLEREEREGREEKQRKEENEDSLTSIYEVLDKGIHSHKNFHLLPNDMCGPLVPTQSRITAGKKTGLEEFPWMALLVYDTDHGFDFRCGGTVINERYVLTAAHCLLESIAGVRLGEYNLDTIKDCDEKANYCAPPTQDFYIEDIIAHPKYDNKSFNNDIALVRLASPANFNVSNVQPICLPTGKMDTIGNAGIVSGWGITEKGFKSSELLKVSVPILPISVCQRTYKRFDTITSDQICAGGYKGRDSCGGDSGGPLKNVGLLEGSPRFIQYGIVSYGPRYCGAAGQPGIYTKVSRYLDWILDNLKPDEDD